MDKQRLEYLFAGYTAGTLPEAETTEFLELVVSGEHRSELESLIQQMMPAVPGSNLPEQSMNEMINIILETVPVRPVVTMKKRSWRVPAAAAVIVLLAVAAWLIFHKPASRTRDTPNIQTTAVHDALPGGHKAILTLSNGQQITLDSAHNGTLAFQGDSRIKKLDSGKLLYEVATGKDIEFYYNTLSTPRGGQYQLTLPDGTKVWLNAASSITYPTAFTGPDRSVRITGEAYFEVAHNAKQPFRVKAGRQVIEDIGTAFNINAYPDEAAAKTTLLEGSVKVSMVNGQWSILKPGEQAIAKMNVAELHSSFTIDHSPDLEEVTAWKNGFFKFNKAGIEDILRQVSRWYDLDVVYAGAKPKGYFRGTVPRNVNASVMLRVIEASGVRYHIEGKKMTVEP